MSSQSCHPLLSAYLGVARLRFGSFLFGHDIVPKPSLRNTPIQAG
ncbi:hypothetical protein [Psychrobacter sp. 72-O-c]|nr:hypothetical protein [Psychrobacter sp. 72-O-c]